MFGWFKKKKNTSSKNDKREKLKAEAMANARKAREAIGEENVQKLAQMLQAHQDTEHTGQSQEQPSEHQESLADKIPNVEDIQDPGSYTPPEGSPAEAAIKIIEKMDKGAVADRLRKMIEEERN